MQNKIKLGIIGKKFGYNVIYKSFLLNKKFDVKGFSFKSKNTDEFKIKKNIKIYPDWKKLISDKKIDAIVISTPPELHKNIIKFAIKNNKHIFCEKPFTCSTREANNICNLIKREKKISHLVNYEFPEIEAFLFFRNKIIKNIKINKIFLNWFIKLKKRSQKNWKENHNKGGGIMFNFVCHAIYYLELLFGKISAIKLNISLEKKKKVKTLYGTIFFHNNISAQINVKVGSINKKIKPVHELKIESYKKIYILKTKLDSLYDKFELIEMKKNPKGNNYKTLYKNNIDKKDFRIKPTFQNSKKFSNWILKGNKQMPNFFNAKRIHKIIDKMLISSKEKRKIYI